MITQLGATLSNQVTYADQIVSKVNRGWDNQTMKQQFLRISEILAYNLTTHKTWETETLNNAKKVKGTSHIALDM